MATGPESVRVWDTTSGQPLSPVLTHADGCMDPVLNSDGRQVAGSSNGGWASPRGSGSGTIRLWTISSVEQADVTAMIPGPNGAFRFSPDARVRRDLSTARPPGRGTPQQVGRLRLRRFRESWSMRRSAGVGHGS